MTSDNVTIKLPWLNINVFKIFDIKTPLIEFKEFTIKRKLLK